MNTSPKGRGVDVLFLGAKTSERLRRVGPGHMEQPPRRPADFIAVNRDIREKTKNSFIWLQAVRGSIQIHVFIHSFILNTTDSPLNTDNGSAAHSSSSANSSLYTAVPSQSIHQRKHLAQ